MNRTLEGSKTTRRNLGGNDDSCQATNPIDYCWQCKKDWAANQMRLADCVLGFGAKTTDGKNGRYYVVNDSSNPDMKLMMTSDKTAIDVEVHIQGGVGNGGMIEDSVQHFELRTQSDGDGISMFGASNIWIDYLSMRNCYDGLVDAAMASTAITISNCNF
ncbi:hypothetical protein Dimus_000449 [Dionaea muscipula]